MAGSKQWSLEEGSETLGSPGYFQKRKRNNPGPQGVPQ